MKRRTLTGKGTQLKNASNQRLHWKKNSAPPFKCIKVKAVRTEEPKTYKNERQKTKQMKIASIADGETATKLIVYDPLKFSMIEPDKSLILKHFICKEDMLVITTKSKVALTSDIPLSSESQSQAESIIYPPPPPVIQLKEAKASPIKKRISVCGKVVKEQITQQVLVKDENVTIKQITLKDASDSCKITLRRDNATKAVDMGDFLTITNVIVNNYRNEISLSSTSLTTIQKTDQPIATATLKTLGYDMQAVITLITDDEDIDYIVSKDTVKKHYNIQEEQLNVKLMELCDSQLLCKVKGNEIVEILSGTDATDPPEETI